MWKVKNCTRLIGLSANFIDVEINLPNVVPWRLTGFYGIPDRNRRHEGWDLLRSLTSKASLPWVCIGDFNDILNQNEKRGKHSQPFNLIAGFSLAISDSGLLDPGMKGYPFTWERGRNTTEFVEEKLDRALVSLSWADIFPNTDVINVGTSVSDHSIIIFRFNEEHTAFVKRFRFENVWKDEADCSVVVKRGWCDHLGMDISNRIRICGEELFRWGTELTHRFKKGIAAARADIHYFAKLNDPDLNWKVTEARQRLNSLLRQRSLYWKQRSKLFWLREGDTNSKLFHKYASHRKQKNSFSSLIDDSGTVFTWGNGLDGHILQYYEQLFTTEGCDDDLILRSVNCRVTSAQNLFLTKPFTTVEVKAALDSMHPEKSPGPDGMNPLFFQHYWSEVGNKVTEACLFYLNSCSLPSQLNETLITLIPKVKQPTRITELK